MPNAHQRYAGVSEQRERHGDARAATPDATVCVVHLQVPPRAAISAREVLVFVGTIMRNCVTNRRSLRRLRLNY